MRYHTSATPHNVAPYADRGYTIAVSEAGLVPLYSGWRAIDAWGLNDRQIAREGSLIAGSPRSGSAGGDFLSRVFSPWVPPPSRPEAWDEMTVQLDEYARAEGYHLAAVFSTVSVPVYLLCQVGSA